jgi:tetratricopeptide (TPR) repeat protein
MNRVVDDAAWCYFFGMHRSSAFLLGGLLSATALASGFAHAQSTARECIDLVRAMTRATEQQDGHSLVKLARRRLTYCTHLMEASDHVAALGSLAQGLNFTKNYQEALGVAERCLGSDQLDLFCSLQKGLALDKLGRTDEAAATLSDALKKPAITEFDVSIKDSLARVWSDIFERQIQSNARRPRLEPIEGNPFNQFDKPTGNFFDRFDNDSRSSNQLQAFVKAVSDGDLNAVRKFLAEGMSANTSTPIFGMPVLHLAQSQSRTEVMKLLIQHGARLNDRFGPSQRTALHDAALDGRLASVRVLLEAGADVNAKNKFGRTPLELTLNPPLPLRSPHNASQVAALLREFGGK